MEETVPMHKSQTIQYLRHVTNKKTQPLNEKSTVLDPKTNIDFKLDQYVLET